MSAVLLHAVPVQRALQVHQETQFVVASQGWFLTQILLLDANPNAFEIQTANPDMFVKTKDVWKNQTHVTHRLADQEQHVLQIVLEIQFVGKLI